MSAWLVSHKHISTLVNFLGTAFPERVGRLLWDENVKSVSQRYASLELGDLPASGNSGDEEYKHQDTYELSPVVILKSCHCLQYQSCETDGWKETEAYRLLSIIEDKATAICVDTGVIPKRHFSIDIRWYLIPEYVEAPWGIEHSDWIMPGSR